MPLARWQPREYRWSQRHPRQPVRMCTSTRAFQYWGSSGRQACSSAAGEFTWPGPPLGSTFFFVLSTKSLKSGTCWLSHAISRKSSAGVKESGRAFGPGCSAQHLPGSWEPSLGTQYLPWVYDTLGSTLSLAKPNADTAHARPVRRERQEASQKLRS